MAILAVQEANLANLANGLLSYSSADVAGDKFLNNGNVLLLVRNLGGSAITLTVAPGGVPLAGLTYTALAYTIDAGDYFIVGPFGVDEVNDGAGFVNITYSGVTSVTLVPIGVS